MSAHSRLGASSLDRRLQCPGSYVLEHGRPNPGSVYAAEGTAAHEIAAAILKGEVANADALVGSVYHVDDFDIPVTAEMIEAVRGYVSRTHAAAGAAGNEGPRSVLVEQELPIGWLVGVEGDTSTADAVVITPERLIVRDLKYGKGVLVDAAATVQPTVYALAALREYDAVIDTDTLREVVVEIDQPRISDTPSRRIFTLAELDAERERIAAGCQTCHEAASSKLANADWNDLYLHPEEKACKFCKAKSTCLALSKHVVDQVQRSFADLSETATIRGASDVIVERVRLLTDDELGNRLRSLSLIEDWCATVRSEGYKRLLNGERIPGVKLVKGRAGARVWADEVQAEEVLTSFRLGKEAIYDFKLISPTQAEKLLADEKTDRRWNKLLPLITRKETKPTLARAEDKGEEWQPIAKQFNDVPQTNDLV